MLDKIGLMFLFSWAWILLTEVPLRHLVAHCDKRFRTKWRPLWPDPAGSCDVLIFLLSSFQAVTLRGLNLCSFVCFSFSYVCTFVFVFVNNLIFF